MDEQEQLLEKEIRQNLSGDLGINKKGLLKTGIYDITTDIHGEPLEFRKDPHLRKAETKIGLTKEHIIEIAKCKKDPVYFMNNYCYINDPNEGRSIITLYQWQEKLVRQLQAQKYNILLLPRQSGKSQTLALFLVWYMCFYKDKLSAILANKGVTAREIFSRLMMAYRGLPHFLKGGVYEFNKSSIGIDTGSGTISSATSESGLRGFTINGLLMIDEAAIIQTSLFEEFYTAMYPTISRADNAKIVLVSTPKGMNHFYKLWRDAQNKNNGYHPFTIGWDEIPGRDEKWKEQEIQNMGDIDKFNQEYCCSFISSGSMLLSSAAMSSITYEPPKKEMYEGTFKIYKEPEPDMKYILSVDTSEGVGKDFSTINVLSVDNTGFIEQVAVYRNNKIELTMFPYTIEKIGQMYNNALTIIENNSIGLVVCNALFNDIEYPELYVDTKEIGIRTTKSTKKAGVRYAKELIENHGLKINDYDTVVELSNFTRRKNSYEAADGFTDDIIMGLVLFSYFSSLPYYKEWCDTDFVSRMYKKKMEQISSEQMLPVYHQDGGEESSNFDEANNGFTVV